MRNIVGITRLIWWRVVALLSLLLGLIGIVVPGLPTVPFVLLSAWAGSKGWPALELWLLRHPTYGPHIVQWREYGAVPRRAKWLATAMMLSSSFLIQVSAAHAWLKLALPLFLLLTAAWLWSRPETAANR